MNETYEGNKQENNKQQDLLSIKLNRVSTKEQKKEIDHALLGIKKRKSSTHNSRTNQRIQLSSEKINKQKLGSKKFYHKKSESLDKNALDLAGIKNTLTANKQSSAKKLEDKLFGIKDKLERKHQVLSNSNKIKRLKKQTKIPSKKKFKPKLKKNLAQAAIEIKTISQFIDENSDTLSEEEKDKFGPIQELDRFENKVFLQSPFGMNQEAIVVEKYGYRGLNDRNKQNYIELLAEAGKPVYGIDNSGSGRVHAVGNSSVTINQ